VSEGEARSRIQRLSPDAGLRGWSAAKWPLDYLGGVTVFGIGLALECDKTVIVVVPQIGQNRRTGLGKPARTKPKKCRFYFSIRMVGGRNGLSSKISFRLAADGVSCALPRAPHTHHCASSHTHPVHGCMQPCTHRLVRQHHGAHRDW
jgi:hypothetical protein